MGWPLGGGHGNPLQYSCLENSMDRGACRVTVQGGAELDTTEQLSTYMTSMLSCLGHIFPDLNPSYHLSYFSLFACIPWVGINKTFTKWSGIEKSKLRSDSWTPFNWGFWTLQVSECSPLNKSHIGSSLEEIILKLTLLLHQTYESHHKIHLEQFYSVWL